MLTLIFILLVLLMSLTVILWAGTSMLQGYIYTQPSAGIYWQAPAAAGLLTFGYTIWALSVAFSSGASTTNIPINVFHKFTPHEDMLERPAKKIWAIKADRKKENPDPDGVRFAYINKRDEQTRFHYQDPNNPKKRWQGQDVIAIEIEIDDKTKMRFNSVKTDVDEYRVFQSADGWVIREYRNDGPTGIPVRFRFTRLLWNVIFNFAHLVGWFLGLWVLLRFQWSHAFGLAVVMWLIVTLTFLPMLLFNAAEVAESRQVRTATISPLSYPITRADGIADASLASGCDRRACSAASCGCWRGLEVPAPCADRRPPPADASRSCAEACAG